MKKSILPILLVFLMLLWGVVFVTSLQGLAGSYPLETVLASIAGSYDKVYEYSGGWKYYLIGGAVTLDNMSPTYGYWIYVNQTGGVNLTINGTVLTNTTFELQPGWNLIGYPSVTSQNLETVLADISGYYDKVYEYSGGWKYYLIGGSVTLDNMTPGYGYWIYVNGSDPINITI